MGLIPRFIARAFKSFGANVPPVPEGQGVTVAAETLPSVSAAPDLSNGTRVPFLDRSFGQCAWLHDDGFVCGRKTRFVGSSWCPEHHTIVFPPRDRSGRGFILFDLAKGPANDQARKK